MLRLYCCILQRTRLAVRNSGIAMGQFSEFYLAARDNDARKIQILLGRGGDVNAVTAGGSTALFRAAQSGHTQALRVLLNDPNVMVEARRTGGRTALFIAAQYAQVDCVRLLLEYNADPATKVEEARSGQKWTALEYVAAKHAQTNDGPEKSRLTAIAALLTKAVSESGLTPDTPNRNYSNRLEGELDNAALTAQGVSTHVEKEPLPVAVQPAPAAG